MTSRLTLDPRLVTPEEAERRMARGFAAFKDAKSPRDYKDAVAEFEKATLAAPWYANAYYNLGQARAPRRRVMEERPPV